MSRAGTAVAGAPPAVPDHGAEDLARPAGTRPSAVRRALRAAQGRRGALVTAYLVYQLVALAAWWHLLGRMGATLPAGSADPAQEVWFLAWLPHALGTGANPFFTTAIFAPQGVNLLSNTSMPLLGLVLSPVTVTAGPVAALDVGVLLAPALSALGAFVLCRRHVSWQPAAFVGGLCYGFGPFLAGDLRFAHLDLTWLMLPPLVFACLDALVVARTACPLRTGAALGALVVAQFFISTEVLAITAVVGGAGLVLGALARPRAACAALRRAGGGLALGGGMAVAALSYPTYLVVAGARHVSGPVWPHIGRIAASLAATIAPHAELRGVAFISGANGSYLGAGLLAVLAVGALVLWRAPPMRVSLGLAALAYVASLGDVLHVGHASTGITMPAWVLGHVPLLDSIVPERFGAMVDLFAGLALAVVVDHARRWTRDLPPSRRRAGGVLAPAVAACALIPLAATLTWPYQTVRVARSAALADAARPVRQGARPPVTLVYPDSSSAVAMEMVWQAQDGFDVRLPDGYAIVPGPDARAVEAPPIDAVWLVFAAASVGRLHGPLSPTTRGAIRTDLGAMHARTLVVLPHARGSAALARAARAVLGPPSAVVDGAQLWRLR